MASRQKKDVVIYSIHCANRIGMVAISLHTKQWYKHKHVLHLVSTRMWKFHNPFYDYKPHVVSNTTYIYAKRARGLLCAFRQTIHTHTALAIPKQRLLYRISNKYLWYFGFRFVLQIILCRALGVMRALLVCKSMFLFKRLLCSYWVQCYFSPRYYILCCLTPLWWFR